MLVQRYPPVHLTYCLNVHPGEHWSENLTAICDKAMKVRDLVACDGPFGLGLRLSNTAARELLEGDELEQLRRFLAENGLYVFTINGFPYGPFHGTSVKEAVYRPDWRAAERRDYTVILVKILEALLPEGTVGSISTVPGSYKAWIAAAADLRAMVEPLADMAETLARMRESSGREICLALEPEPDCYIENTDEGVAFFTGPLREIGMARLRGQHGLSADDAEGILARHLGVCFDTAHAAVAFEDPAASLKRLKAARVRVAKIHLSSAVRVGPGARPRAALSQFDEDVYLHQVKVRDAAGVVHSYADLPQALAAAPEGEWRVHFHVPLFFEGAGDLQSTSSLLRGLGPLIREGITEHLEIETYTFGVLPGPLAVANVTEGIAREYRWVLDNLLSGATG